jgi:putative nucleotidyltransferase with HDIG domain
MRLVSIDNVKENEYLAKTIYDSIGRVILGQGVRLTTQFLCRLKELNVSMIYVDDGNERLLDVDSAVSEETRKNVILFTKQALLEVKAGNSHGHRKIEQSVSHILDEVINNKDLLIRLVDVYLLKDHTFNHSINVCILSLMTGMAMGFREDHLRKLGTGALLHDVGKGAIPEYMVSSKERFTDEEYKLIKKHTDFGYDILSKIENIDPSIPYVAWQHHERYNGNGYPKGLAGDAIHEFARIVAVADVYEAMSGDRPYREKYKLYEVAELIQAVQGIDFEPAVVQEFMRVIVPLPVGSLVKLNTGFKGIVVQATEGYPTRPRVRLLYDLQGRRMEGLHIVNLMKELTLFITEVIEEKQEDD